MNLELTTMTVGRHRGAMVLLGVVLAALPASAEPLTTQAELEQAGFRLHWEASLPLAKGDSVVAGYLRDDTLYVATDSGWLFSVTADNGLIRWAHDVAEPGYKVYAPTHMATADGDGPVVVPTTTFTYIYDRYTGRLLQRYVPSYGSAGPVVAGGNIVIAGAVAPRVTATRVGLDNYTKTMQLWEVATDAPVTTRPLLINSNDVVFASQGGTVYRCAGIDKTLRFAIDVGGSILSDPAVDATGIFVASTDRSLYKVSMDKGRIAWRVRFEEPLRTGPVVVDKVVYQWSGKSGMTAMDADTGKVRWRRLESKQFVSNSKAGVALWTNDGNIVVVDPQSGEAITGITTRGVRVVVSNTTDDAVFLLGRDGTLNALRLGDVPYIERQQMLAARRMLNQKPTQPEPATTAPASQPKPQRRRNDDPLRSRRDIVPH